MQRHESRFPELGFPDQQAVVCHVGDRQIQSFGDPQPGDREQRDQCRMGPCAQAAFGSKLKGGLDEAIDFRCRVDIDEQYPHIHAFILPRDDPKCLARDLNPAWGAKQLVEQAARSKGLEPSVALKLGNRAYKAAGPELQDDYHSEVGLRVGLTRTGPKRRRLSRAQWQMEKRQAVENAEIIEGIEDKMVALIEADDALTAKVSGQVSSLDEAELAAETLRRAAQEDREIAARARLRADDAAKAMRQSSEREAALILADAQAKAKAVLLEERAGLEQQRAALANQQEQLRKDRRTFERDRAFEMKRAVREAITVAILAIKGVIDGSIVHDASSNRLRVSDQTLAQRITDAGIRSLLEPVLVHFCAVWERLKDRLNRAELAHEQAVTNTDLHQAQQAVRKHDVGEQEVGSPKPAPKPAPEAAVNTSFGP